MLKVIMNAAAMEAVLRNIAERANANAARTLKRASIRVRDLARMYAPRDTGALEKSLDYGAKREGRRNSYIVFVRGDAAAANGKTVGDYASIMETQLTPVGRLKLGKRSEAKATGGAPVGGGYLSRAVEKGSESINEEMMAAAISALSSSPNGRAR
jgi:hypothetical protein